MKRIEFLELREKINSNNFNCMEKIKLVNGIKITPIMIKKLLISYKLSLLEAVLLVYNLNSNKLLETYLSYYHSCDFSRNKAFENLLFCPDEIYKLAYKGYLSEWELKRAHNTYNMYYFHKLKKSFHNYYRYCTIFNKYLYKYERKILVKKLMNRKYQHNISRALNEIDFSLIERETLIKYGIIFKLTI